MNLHLYIVYAEVKGQSCFYLVAAKTPEQAIKLTTSEPIIKITYVGKAAANIKEGVLLSFSTFDSPSFRCAV